MKKSRAALVLSLAIGISMALAALAAKHRQPWSDEGWFSDPAYNLSYHGFFGTTSLETDGTRLVRMEQRTYWTMPLYLVAQAGWYFVVPPTVFWTRMLSVLWVPLAIVSFYILALRTSGRSAVALLAACLLAADYNLIDNAGFARPEIMCLALGLAGMAVYAALRERSLIWAVALSNILVAASGLTHPNGVLHLAGLIVLALWFDRGRLGWRHLAGAVGCYAAAGAIWGIYIGQDVDAFLSQMRANSGSRVASTWNPFALVWYEVFERYAMVYGIRSPEPVARLKGLVLFSFAAAWAAAWLARALRRESGAGLWLLLWAAYFGIQCVFNQKLSYYFVHIVPIYVFLFAAAVEYAWRTAPRARILLCCWVALICALQAGGVVLKSHRRDVAVHGDMARFLRDHAGSAQRIFGSSSMLYAMQFDRRLLDDPLLGAATGKTAEVIVLIDNLYGDLYRQYASMRPRDLERIRKRLAEYDVVFDVPNYRILFHRSFSPQTVRIGKQGR